MKRTTQAIKTLATVVGVGLAMALLAAPASAVEVHLTAQAPLAKGAGYDRGSKEVKVLQRRLRLAGHHPGRIDGLFGPVTEAAVVNYQQRAGLAADGLVGPKTWDSLRRSAKALRVGRGYGSARGSARVRTLQRSLRLVGAQPGPTDGRFGPRTEAAVIHFQRSHRLAADGVAGTLTLRTLTRTVRNVVHRESRPDKAERTRANPPLDGMKPVNTARQVRDDQPVGRPVGQTQLTIALGLMLLVAAAMLTLPRLLSRWRGQTTTSSGRRLHWPHSPRRRRSG